MALSSETLFKISPRAVLHFSLPEGCSAAVSPSDCTIRIECGDEQSRREALVRLANLLMQSS